MFSVTILEYLHHMQNNYENNSQEFEIIFEKHYDLNDGPCCIAIAKTTWVDMFGFLSAQRTKAISTMSGVKLNQT